MLFFDANAGVAEWAADYGLKSVDRKVVWVRLPPSAPLHLLRFEYFSIASAPLTLAARNLLVLPVLPQRLDTAPIHRRPFAFAIAA